MGETLTADTTGIADTDGLTDVSYSYQWVANDGTIDTDIPDATDAAYTLVADDEGQTIKVRVIVTDDAGNETTLTSAATAVVAAPEPPAKPTGLSPVVVSHDAVTLTWDDPQDDSITGYVISLAQTLKPISENEKALRSLHPPLCLRRQGEYHLNP